MVKKRSNKFIRIFKQLVSSVYIKAFVLLLVFFFTFTLRAHNYDRMPEMKHLEEMLYAWSGMYLIETGVPVSWSTLSYPDRAEVFRGAISYNGSEPIAYVRLYKPWLDEPPLFSLLIGASDLYFGAKKESFPATSFTRFPMIFIALLSSIMIFLLARKLSGFWVGIVAVLLYGTIPTMVLASRTAVPENLIGLFLITMVYLIVRFKDRYRFYWIVAIPILAGIAGLSKPTGYLLMPLAVYYMISFKKYKEAFYIFIATVPFVFAFFIYGNYYDPEIFSIITKIQSYRPVGFSSLAWFFSSPAYYIHIVIESWYVFGLLSLAYFIFNPPDDTRKVIIFSTVYWIIVVMISGGEQDTLPWYRFPMFPLLAIITVWGLQIVIKQNNFFSTFLVMGMLLGNRVLLVNAFHPNVYPYEYRFAFTGLMLPSLLGSIFRFNWLERLNKILVILVISIGIYINSVYIYNAFEIECESKTCAIGESTWLSRFYFPVFWRLFKTGFYETKGG